MSRSNTIAKDFWYTLFGNRESEQLEQELETYDEESLEVRREGRTFKKPSLYVKVFEGEGHATTESQLPLTPRW
jgi:Fanconi-associated nuclease 1